MATPSLCKAILNPASTTTLRATRHPSSSVQPKRIQSVNAFRYRCRIFCLCFSPPHSPPRGFSRTILTHLHYQSRLSINLRFDCSFSVAEAQQGLSIPYTLYIEQEPSDLSSQVQESGDCRSTGGPGLFFLEKRSGQEQEYCMIDDAKRQPQLTQDRASFIKHTLQSNKRFRWKGRNTDIPESTEESKAFPLGVYTLEISSKGSFDNNGVKQDFHMSATMEITLTP